MLLHNDGFDHWGTVANMSEGIYAVASGVLDGSIKRTGNYSYGWDGTGELRIALDAPVTTLGCGMGFLVKAALPIDNDRPATVCYFANSANQVMLWFWIGADGSINATVNPDYPSGITNLFPLSPIITTDPVMTPDNFRHIEIEVKLGNPGRIIIAVDSIVKATYNGILFDTETIGQWCQTVNSFFTANVATTPRTRIDDFFLRDDSGTENNTLLGDRVCLTQFPTADEIADWTLSSGTDGFALIDQVPPSDVDYIEATTAGLVAEFDKTPLTLATTGIAGATIYARTQKTDAGLAQHLIGIHSGAVVQNSAPKSSILTRSYTKAIVENNPNGDVPFTNVAWDAAKIRLTRNA